MFIISDEERGKPGWLAEGYTEHDLTQWTYEAADASHFVKFTITTLRADVEPWDRVQVDLADVFQHVGTACLAGR